MPDKPEPTEEELEERLRKLLDEAETADEAELDDIELRLRDVEARFQAAQENRETDDRLFDAEFEDKLDKLHERADASKQRREGAKSEAKRKSFVESDSSRSLGIGLSIAYTITGLPLLGVGIGWLIDNAAGTTMWKGICMLIGAVIGLAMAFVMMNKSAPKK